MQITEIRDEQDLADFLATLEGDRDPKTAREMLFSLRTKAREIMDDQPDVITEVVTDANTSELDNLFSALTPAELERLALLQEEMGEAAVAIGKIIRHGYDSHNPHDVEHDGNRSTLETELRDVIAAMQLMVLAGDMPQNIFSVERTRRILGSKGEWLHHQDPQHVGLHDSLVS